MLSAWAVAEIECASAALSRRRYYYLSTDAAVSQCVLLHARRGHVMFPKAKTHVESIEHRHEASAAIEKEDERGRAGAGGAKEGRFDVGDSDIVRPK